MCPGWEGSGWRWQGRTPRGRGPGGLIEYRSVPRGALAEFDFRENGLYRLASSQQTEDESREPTRRQQGARRGAFSRMLSRARPIPTMVSFRLRSQRVTPAAVSPSALHFMTCVDIPGGPSEASDAEPGGGGRLRGTARSLTRSRPSAPGFSAPAFLRACGWFRSRATFQLGFEVCARQKAKCKVQDAWRGMAVAGEGNMSRA